MKYVLVAAAGIVFGASNSASFANSPGCPAGEVTCARWCAKHPERTNCMTGNPNSCDKKPKGPRTCVHV